MGDDGHFGEAVAAVYDDDAAMFDPEVVEPCAALLAELAEGGNVLEFGIGTGRIALPLLRRGLDVQGIELSRAMVERLRAKPGGDAIGVTIGDFASARARGRFDLVYLVFNTINNLTSQDAQVAAFVNAAAHLRPGGRFVVEVGVPPLQRLPPGETRLAFALSEERMGMDEIDVVSQGFVSHHVTSAGGRVQRASIPFRYVWPSELDLMARIAGMERVARWAGWRREPFTALSPSHVSVWAAS